MTSLNTHLQEQAPIITSRELIALYQRREPVTMIDVRERAEWDAGHIDGAIHIPKGILEFTIRDHVPDRHVPIVVYCASGARSALAAETLQQLGYTNVKNLEGGYLSYRHVI